MLLAATGAALLGLNIFLGSKYNVALPLVFLMLGGGFYIAVFATQQKWPWTAALYLPGSLFLALGLVFGINVLTNDWNSWAYAWLLLVAALGAGILMTNAALAWHPVFNQIGIGLSAGGLALFAVFGAIVGGVFIQVMAPILLILGGAWLYWLRPETVFPEHILQRLHLAPHSAPPADPLPDTQPAGLSAPGEQPEPLVEALSARELEVLRMVDSGLSNQQIALKLSIAPSTVKTHINNLYGKMAVQTRVQAIKRARDLGLL